MQPLTIREKLYDYIRVADDKKIKAIYSLLENDIEETNEWWQDKALVSNLDKRYQEWKAGKEKGYTINEVQADLLRIKSSKTSK